IFDVSTGELLRSYQPPIRSEQTNLSEKAVNTLAWSSDGTQFMGIFGNTSLLYIWDADTGTPLKTVALDGYATLSGCASQVTWSPDRTKIFNVTDAGTFRGMGIWDTNTGEVLTNTSQAQMSYPTNLDAAWSPDGSSIAL